jgi:heat-inducible transcriptional repressor
MARNMAPTKRAASILSLIVEDYVESAQPIGSKALVDRHDLNYSSATVRSEMAALENEGLITHPHTSAGRIPSSAGYRYYVGTLMGENRLSSQEQLTILHQFHQSAPDLNRLAALAASVLAHALQNVAIATTPHMDTVSLKQLQLVQLTEEQVLLVVVTGDASIRQRVLELPDIVDQEYLTYLARKLNERCAGQPLSAVLNERNYVHNPENKSLVTDLERIVISTVYELLSGEGLSPLTPPVVEGVREMLRQPEYGGSDQFLDALEAMEATRLQQAIPSVALEDGNVMIVIGDESQNDPYGGMSFVLSRYGPSDATSGLLGVIGPTRLDYAETVAHVRYVRDILTNLLSDSYTEMLDA